MPDTYAELVDTLESKGNQSSLMNKASPDLRRRLIEALTGAQRDSYRVCYARFELDALGISFTAFYYWARKIRHSAHLTEMARNCPPDENPAELLPRIIGYHLLDVALGPDMDLKALDTLSRTFKRLHDIEFARQRLDLHIRIHEDKRAAAAHSEPVPPGSVARDALRAAANPLDHNPNNGQSLRTSDKNYDNSPAAVAPSEPVPQGPVARAPSPADATDTKHHPDRNPNNGRTLRPSDKNYDKSPNPAVLRPSSIPHSKFRIPKFPDPFSPRFNLDDLHDPDPRREALRQRIKEDFRTCRGGLITGEVYQPMVIR